MSDKLTAITPATLPLAGTELAYVVQGGNSRSAPVSSLINANLTAWSAVNPSAYLNTAGIAAAYQPLDSDLTAIAALTTTATGRALLTIASAAAGFDSLAPTTTRGDLIFRNATTNARLAASTLGYHLQTNGAGTDPSYAGFLQTGTGAVTRTWQSKGTDTVSVLDFGAVGDGVTDNITTLTAAFNSGARHIVIPFGVFVSSPGLVIPNFVTVEGGGPGCSILTCNSATGDFISIGSAACLRYVSINHSVTRTSGKTVKQTGNDSELSNYSMTGFYIGVSIEGASSGSPIVSARLYNGSMSAPGTAVGGVAVSVTNYSSPYVSNILATGITGATQPETGLFIGSGDTLFFTACHFVGFVSPLRCDPPANTTSFTVQFSNCMFDSSQSGSGACIGLRPFNANAGIKFWSFNNCWVGTSSNIGLWCEAFGAGAVVDGVQFNDGRIINLAGAGVHVAAGASNIVIDGNTVGKCGGKALRALSTAAHVQFTNNMVRNIGALGVNVQGVSLEDTCDYVTVAGNDVQGSTATITNTSSGTHNVIQNNPGYNPVGASALTPSASPWTYTAGSSPETVYISATTGISAVNQSAVTPILPATLGANVPFSITLGPNEFFSTAYTGTMTAKKMVH